LAFRRDEALARQVRAPESTTIPWTVQDGLNLSAFGVISPPEAGKDKSVSMRYVELKIPPWRDLYGYN